MKSEMKKNIERARDVWFFRLLTEELGQFAPSVRVAELYRRRLAGDEPTRDEWEAAAVQASDASCSSEDTALASREKEESESAALAALAAESAALVAIAVKTVKADFAAAWSNRLPRLVSSAVWAAATSAWWETGNVRFDAREAAKTAARQRITSKLVSILRAHGIDPAVVDLGRLLETAFGPELAGGVIYLASTGRISSEDQ